MDFVHQKKKQMILPYFSFKTFILVLLIPFHAAWLPQRTKQSIQVLWACEGRLTHNMFCMGALYTNQPNH